MQDAFLEKDKSSLREQQIEKTLTTINENVQPSFLPFHHHPFY